MVKSNQPFKRPSLSESDEFAKIPPPVSSEPVNPAVSGMGPQGTSPPQGAIPPTQEEIQWAVSIEERVQKQGYKPNDQEMARYQDIANRILHYQRMEAQKQAQQQAAFAAAVKQSAPNPPKKKNRFFTYLKILFAFVLLVLFWAKAAFVVLQPSYLTPRGKIYILIKPALFSKVYYSVNMDNVYEEKIKSGFKKEELDGSVEGNQSWYADPSYWEMNYLAAFPYFNVSALDISF